MTFRSSRITIAILNLSAQFAAAVDFDAKIRPFLDSHCVSCHGPDKQKSDFRVDTLDSEFLNGRDADLWQRFQTYNFQFKDGTVASGFVTARDDKRIELRNVAGIRSELKSADVAKEDILKISMMPPGLVNSLTLQQLASLIDYLQSLH